jgi:molybdenum cofactor cytidylyltransferase
MMALTNDFVASDDSPGGGGLNVSIILLAAGSSSRMGHSKQLLEIHGEPLLLHSAKAALASGAKSVIVILGANEQPHREIINNLPVNIIANHYWKSGMGSSIKAGLNYLIRKSSETEAVIIMVCDQPALTERHLQNLILEFMESRSPIVASSYSGTAGVPALFARSFFSNILMLRDEQGAKKIIQQFPEQVKTLDFPEGVFDLDTAEDYQNYLKRK